MLAQVEPIVVKLYRAVVVSFFRMGQLRGRYGSSGPSKSTIFGSLLPFNGAEEAASSTFKGVGVD